MKNLDLTIKIGGEAGQGLKTVGELLSYAFCRKGYHVFANQALQSRIRGGHNWFQLRVSDAAFQCPSAKTDILVALDKESEYHFKELTPDSIVVLDSKQTGPLELDPGQGRILDAPMLELAKQGGGNKLMINTVAAALVMGLLDFDPAVLFGLLREIFAKKSKELGETNVSVAKAGYDFALEKKLGEKMPDFKAAGPGKMLIPGSEAIALGALAAGCQFMSAYPMSPSTGIMTYLASKTRKFNFVMEQSEDEIASINIALGASYAGLRSMTASSGGGFALMVEGLSLAGMLETPIVIVLAQRPAPATGLPTRTAQEDLLFAIYAGHGEFARFVTAPSDIESSFYAVARAFNLAEKYRIPAIILTDQSLADSFATVDGFRLQDIRIERNLMTEEELKKAGDGYKSYLLTKTGVSPRALPGNPFCFVTADSDEHDEDGRITEDVDYTRPEMVKKRNIKAAGLLKEAKGPSWHGPANATDILICWGSTRGAVQEAVDRLNKDNPRVAMAHFEDVWPLNPSYFDFLKKAKLAAVVENNFTGQFAGLITKMTGHLALERILKYNGMPFTADEIISAFEELRKKPSLRK
ncbi:MAG: 2-oxoacid:acceptor oxidoreductase subunit alpha [Candidatus Omnitrophota bacterium]